jgi:hypothetical protein
MNTDKTRHKLAMLTRNNNVTTKDVGDDMLTGNNNTTTEGVGWVFERKQRRHYQGRRQVSQTFYKMEYLKEKVSYC